MKNTSRILTVLMVIYAILFLVLAINPVDRTTWYAESLTVWIVLAVILRLHKHGAPFSKAAYVLMFIPIYLHTIGGHYTFSNVPFDWVTNLFGFTRNHYDRVAHFSVGFYAFPIAEWLYHRRLVANRLLLFTYPVFVIATIAAFYELVEWVYATRVDPATMAAFLGNQGDIWDAQKDMLADILGALVSILIFFGLEKLWKRKLNSREE